MANFQGRNIKFYLNNRTTLTSYCEVISTVCDMPITISKLPLLPQRFQCSFNYKEDPQLTFTCSKLAIETLENGKKYVQS